MKILYISNLYPPNGIGGYEQLCFDVASALSERGHDTLILTSGYGGAVADYTGQRVFRELSLLARHDNIYMPAGLSADERVAIETKNAGTLKRLVTLERPDVIFVWNLYFLTPSLLDALDISGNRVVFFLTDNWLAAFLKPTYVGEYFRNKVFRKKSTGWNWQFRISERWKKRRINGNAIFSSKFMADFYAAAGISFVRQTIIHNGVKFHDSARKTGLDRSNLLRRGQLALLFAGRIVEIKGVLTAVHALEIIINRYPELEVTLTVLGDQRESEYVGQVKAECERIGISDRVIFREAVPEAEMPMLFDSYDVYLFPSLYEPFSLTLLHAMHSGIPIVSSNAGGNSEAIKNGQTGLLFETGSPIALADAVVGLVRDPKQRAALGAAATTASKQFNFERMINQLEEYLGDAKCG